MVGTIVNTLTIIAGSTTGLLIQKRLPQEWAKAIFAVLGIFTLYLGFDMTQQTTNVLILIFSLVIGTILGEWWKLEKSLERLTQKFAKGKTNDGFAQGLITAFLLFCIGPMTIIGAFEEGVNQDPQLLITKAIMDGISSIALAAAFGRGVLFSAIPLFVFQGTLTLLAHFFGDILPDELIKQMIGTGGILLIGLGLNIIGLTKIRVTNQLPALLVALALAWLFLIKFPLNI